MTTERDGHPPYHPEAAALAWRRTLDFLGQHLGDNARQTPKVKRLPTLE